MRKPRSLSKMNLEMKVLMVHNKYGKTSGEEIMISRVIELLRNHDHEVSCYFRSSSRIKDSLREKIKAFFSGIYSPSSRKLMRKIIQEHQPNLIQVQNVYPFISPSALVEARKQKIPLVMRCANYRLICPNGLSMTKGRVCEKCSGGREWWCFFRNCEGSRLKSFGYALRSYVARKRRYFLDNVTVYYAQTEFQRRRLIQNGFPPDRMFVIPNMVDLDEIQISQELGQYVAYVGRISPEKGLLSLIESARSCRDIQFKAAGSYDRMPHLLTECSENFKFYGHLDKEKLHDFYQKSRIVVLCSICYEGFPSVSIEAMLRGKPLIASRIGGMPEIIDDGVTGLLFKPGNAEDLGGKIRYLWDRPNLCRKMGQAGREKALREYSREKYYKRLMGVYQKAIALQQDSSYEKGKQG